LRYGGSNQLANTGSVQIRRLSHPNVPNEFALATQQAVRIGQQRAKVKAEVHPIGMRGGEDERITRSLREREVVGDSVHLVDELAGCRRFFEDQFSSGQCELLNRLAVRQEESEILRIW
jgi:hypothetical protein